MLSIRKFTCAALAHRLALSALGFVSLLLLVQRIGLAEPRIEISFDEHGQVAVNVDRPVNADTLLFAPLDGMTRQDIWQVSDGARLDRDVLRFKPGISHVMLIMTTTGNQARSDRTYAPFLRISSAAVAVNNQLFMTLDRLKIVYADSGATRGSCGLSKSAQTRGSINESLEGYAVMGRVACDHLPFFDLIYDSSANKVGVGHLREAAERIATYYSRWLGAKRVVIMLCEDRTSAKGTSFFHGDSLGSGITLTFAKIENDEFWASQDARGYSALLAHELFHQWTGSSNNRDRGDRDVLLEEGGAEVAASYYRRGLAPNDMPARVDFLASKINACVLDVGVGRSIANVIDGHSLGRVPYDCGVPAMLLAMPGAPLQERTFFDYWRKRAEDSRDSWQAARSSRGDVAALAKVIARLDIAASFAKLFAERGVHLEETASLSAPLNAALFLQIAQFALLNDCQGSAGFWVEGATLKLDRTVKSCHALAVADRLASIMGVAVDNVGESLDLLHRVTEACEQHGEIPIVAVPAAASPVVHCSSQVLRSMSFVAAPGGQGSLPH